MLRNSTSSSSSRKLYGLRQSTRDLQDQNKAKKVPNRETPRKNNQRSHRRSTRQNEAKNVREKKNEKEKSTNRSRNYMSSPSSSSEPSTSKDTKISFSKDDPLTKTSILNSSRHQKRRNMTKKITDTRGDTFPRSQPVSGCDSAVEKLSKKSTSSTSTAKNTESTSNTQPTQSTRDTVKPGKIIRHELKNGQKMVLVVEENNAERWIPAEEMHPDEDHKNNELSLTLLKYYDNFLVPAQFI